MATKKTTNKKPASKATPTKKAAPKAKAAPAATESNDVVNPDDMDLRRPDTGPSVPPLKIGELTQTLETLRDTLETYAAHLRSLDRKRLNGVGIKKQGFIDAAYLLAVKNPEFLPHWLTVTKFRADQVYFQSLRTLCDMSKQIHELLWNIASVAADMVYTDALEFYDPVESAAKRRVDAAETIFNELAPFFKHRKRDTEQPTEKKTLRDFKALQHGKKDGKIVIENISPKVSKGKHIIIDETFKDTDQYKETDEGEIKE